MREVSQLFDQWEKIPADARQEKIEFLANNAAVLLRLTDLKHFSVALATAQPEDGFEWVLQEVPGQLPWMWSNKALAVTLPLVDGAPLSPIELLQAMKGMDLPPDGTGAIASLAWFAFMVAFFSWWDCRLTGRVSVGLLFQDVTVDSVVHADTVGTGRRFGPLLPSP